VIDLVFTAAKDRLARVRWKISTPRVQAESVLSGRILPPRQRRSMARR
jgi:hypothetical protein